MTVCINPGPTLPAGNNGEVLSLVGQALTFVEPIVPHDAWWSIRDAAIESAAFASGTSGAGASVALVADAVYPFLTQLSAGTSGTGRASRGAQMTGTAISFGASSNQIVYKCLSWAMPTLSSAAPTAVVRLGFMDSNSAAPVDGAYFEFDANTDVNMQCKTASNSSRTTTDTTWTPAAATYYDLMVIATNVTNVKFYYRTTGSKVWTLLATHTADIPSGTTRSFGVGHVIIQSANATPLLSNQQLQVCYQQTVL